MLGKGQAPRGSILDAPSSTAPAGPAPALPPLPTVPTN
jgi:preprotein translocase subunit SecG